MPFKYLLIDFVSPERLLFHILFFYCCLWHETDSGNTSCALLFASIFHWIHIRTLQFYTKEKQQHTQLFWWKIRPNGLPFRSEMAQTMHKLPNFYFPFGMKSDENLRFELVSLRVTKVMIKSRKWHFSIGVAQFEWGPAERGPYCISIGVREKYECHIVIEP